MPKTFKTKNEYHLERKLIFIENIGLRYTYIYDSYMTTM